MVGSVREIIAKSEVETLEGWQALSKINLPSSSLSSLSCACACFISDICSLSSAIIFRVDAEFDTLGAFL